jgi:hypothetical protein
LIADLAAFREGFERTMQSATLVKLSDEDAVLLCGRQYEGLAESLFEHGVEIGLLTRGKLGARVFTRSGLNIAVPALSFAGPIVDTMGAGDATLASVIADILSEGVPRANEGWRACLRRAMDIAAAACRCAGGALVAEHGRAAPGSKKKPSGFRFAESSQRRLSRRRRQPRSRSIRLNGMRAGSDLVQPVQALALLLPACRRTRFLGSCGRR